jgi:hypothetical protein
MTINARNLWGNRRAIKLNRDYSEVAEKFEIAVDEDRMDDALVLEEVLGAYESQLAVVVKESFRISTPQKTKRKTKAPN